jgi:hypothetical protein
MLGGILLATTSGHAGVLTATWTAPTTNTDGSAVTDLAFYRVYYDTSDLPCPGSTFFEVASPTPTPQPGQTLSFQLTGLTTASIYNVSITAVSSSGGESSCSDIAGAIARDDSTATTDIAGAIARDDSTATTFCANEADFCAFSGTKTVRFGAGTTFVSQTLTGGTACTTFVFGDPLPGVFKHCDIQD